VRRAAAEPDAPPFRAIEPRRLHARRTPRTRTGVNENKLFVEGTWNADFVEPMRPQPGDLIVTGKKGLDAFPGSDLEALLVANGVRTIVLGGFLTNCARSAGGADALRPRRDSRVAVPRAALAGSLAVPSWRGHAGGSDAGGAYRASGRRPRSVRRGTLARAFRPGSCRRARRARDRLTNR
jgi:nicotinamidase-related amidase